MTRQATSPSKFLTTPMQVITVPQQRMRKVSHMLGRTFLRTMLDGISGVVNAFAETAFGRESLTEDDVWDKEDGASYVVLVIH